MSTNDTPPTAAPTAVPSKDSIDTTQLQFSKDTSEAGMPDVIEERDERDEEERKTAQGMFSKASPRKVQSQ